MHVGIGSTQVNGLFAALNLPGIDDKTLKKREREAGAKIESVAKTSCDDNLELEKKAVERYLLYITVI